MPIKLHKFYNIQALRGVAILLVVLLHLLVIEKKYGHGLMMLPNILNIGAVGVDIFFVISGFIMATIIQGQFQKPHAFSHFMISRITRIYPLYWFYSLLVLIVFITHPTWVNQFEGSHVNIFKSFLLLPQKQLPLLLVGWTLIHEIYFYLIIALLLFLPEKYFTRGLFTWLILIIINYKKTEIDATLALVTYPLTCEFILGCYIARITKLTNSHISWFLFIASIILLCTGFYNYQYTYHNSDIQGWYRVMIYGLPSVFLVYACISLENDNVLLAQFLQKIGDASYSIYLSHVLILSTLGRLCIFLPMQNKYIHLFTFAFMLICVILFGILSYNFIEKPIIKMSRYSIHVKSIKFSVWIKRSLGVDKEYIN